MDASQKWGVLCKWAVGEGQEIGGARLTIRTGPHHFPSPSLPYFCQEQGEEGEEGVSNLRGLAQTKA